MTSLVQEHSLSLIGLVETKVRDGNHTPILKYFLPGWTMVHNYNHNSSGRIWVLWNSEVLDVSMVFTSDQYIHLSAVIIEKQIRFQATFIYGHNTAPKRLPLWNDLLSLRRSLPWILLGDFNVVRFMNERLGGDPDWPPHMEDLNSCCTEAMLEDLKATSFHYTWDNRSSGDRFLTRKLDRVLVNPDWMSTFPLAKAAFLPAGSLDHSPTVVNLGVELYRRRGDLPFFQFLGYSLRF